MPRGDAVTLADVRAPSLEIACEPCGRRGRYDVERLIAEHGAAARLPDLLVTVANCEKARSISIHDRCRARYGLCAALGLRPLRPPFAFVGSVLS
jgi:hypothetical protein